MNYCEKIRYRIFSVEKDAFPVMVDRLLGLLPKEEAVLRLAFFGTPPSSDEYLMRREVLKEKVATCFGEREPALSYVSQPPLHAALLVEVHSFVPDEMDKILYKRFHNYPYSVLENEEGRFLFAGGFQSDELSKSIEQQSADVFRQIEELLALEHFPIDSIIRQWNYIEQITYFREGSQHYQSFNNARGDFYGKTTWANGYPAATGIGANLGGVLVDLDAVVFTSPTAFATPIDNPLQVAAHAYSDNVLEVARQQKATPKFERAKSMTFGSRRLLYISGTAAIRGEESLKGVGLVRQLQATMENISRLIDKARPAMLRVYLKDRDAYTEAERLMNDYRLDIPISYMWADVCRDELLIEIEGIAIE